MPMMDLAWYNNGVCPSEQRRGPRNTAGNGPDPVPIHLHHLYSKIYFRLFRIITQCRAAMTIHTTAQEAGLTLLEGVKHVKLV